MLGLSIGDRARATKGGSSGFDYLRLFLALSIVLLHSWLISGGAAADEAIMEGPARPLLRMILPIFFALSGYLVASSLERTETLVLFFGLRALRIYPALLAEVLLSAMLVGPFVTSFSFRDYFRDPLFISYFRNALGDMHYALPGVFQSTPLKTTVNGQLWTVPFELYCYLVLGALTLLGVKTRRGLAPASVALVSIAYLVTTLLRHNGIVVHVTGAVNGALLVATFLAGVSIYMYRDILPWSKLSCGAALLVAMALLAYVPCGDFFAPAFVAYATVCLGLFDPPKLLGRGADYSYGIFLYSFVIQQTVVDLIPAAHAWYVNALVSLPLVGLAAAASWHCIEKPAKRLRPLLTELERTLTSARPPTNKSWKAQIT